LLMSLKVLTAFTNNLDAAARRDSSVLSICRALKTMFRVKNCCNIHLLKFLITLDSIINTIFRGVGSTRKGSLSYSGAAGVVVS
jgi:hypothetical protein